MMGLRDKDALQIVYINVSIQEYDKPIPRTDDMHGFERTIDKISDNGRIMEQL